MARSTAAERLLDHYGGSVFAQLYGLFHQKRALPAMPARIGLIQPTAIGDLIIATGLVNHLRKRYPAAEIHIFHGPSNAQVLSLLDADVVGHCCRFKRLGQTLSTLRAAKLDVLIDCTPWSRLTAILCYLSGARFTVGFESPGQRRHYGFDAAIPYGFSSHVIENFKRAGQIFGPLDRYEMALRPPGQPRPIPLNYDRLVIFHAFPGGARAKQKSWPIDRWAALAVALTTAGYEVAFSGTAADAEAINEIIDLAGLPPELCFSLAGQFDLAQLSHVLTQARLLVTVDTGVAHLAGALNGNLVALHGPTRFATWGAAGAGATGLDSPHPSAGYINFGFESHPDADEIMHALSLEVVLSTVLGRLATSEQLQSQESP